MTRRAGMDWLLLGAVLLLSVLGCLLVWSATSARGDLTGGDPRAYLEKQIVNVAIGLALLVLVLATDHRWVRIVAPLVYLGSVGGLVLVLTMGTVINGSRSWLMLGGLSIQPSEFAKLAVVIGMALVVAERAEGRWRPRVGTVDVVAMLVIAAVPAVLILLQPDLGTMLVLAATVFGVLAASGAPRRWLAGLSVGAVVGAVLAVRAGVLKDYQVDRFLAFTNPDLDPRGAGYNVEQARIAVGNGGWFGNGLLNGSQTRSGFVPEQHTDFVFTVAGEELGLVGSALIIALLGIVLWRALSIAVRTDDVFGRVAAAGIACWFGFQAFQNIGMCLGIMPVTGVPLPFVSYGGSSMFAGMLAVGLLLNISRRAAEAPAARLQPAKRVLVRVSTALVGQNGAVLTVRLLPRRGAAARAAAAAVESTTALVAGHTLAGGMLPSLPWILLMGAAVFLAGLPVLNGRLRLRWAVPVLVVLQLVLHAWLTVLAPMPEMAVSGAMVQVHGSSLGGMLAPHMLLVHVTGALLTALLWELRAQVVDVIVTWARPDLPPLPGVPSAPARTPLLLWTVTDLVTLTAPRRGPPVLAGLVPAHA